MSLTDNHISITITKIVILIKTFCKRIFKKMKNVQNTTDPRIAFFDSLAENWDGEKPSESEMAARLSQHTALLGFTRGMDILEVGCGTGKTTSWLINNVAPGKVTAVDFSPAMITNAAQKSLPADFICMDVCSERFNDRKFDAVFCFHSFPHFRNQSAALRI